MMLHWSPPAILSSGRAVQPARHISLRGYRGLCLQGVIVAAPVYAATGSRWRAMGIAVASVCQLTCLLSLRGPLRLPEALGVTGRYRACKATAGHVYRSYVYGITSTGASDSAGRLVTAAL